MAPKIIFKCVCYCYQWMVWVCFIALLLLCPLIMFGAAFKVQEKNMSQFDLEKDYIFVFGALTFIRRWSVTPVSIPLRQKSFKSYRDLLGICCTCVFRIIFITMLFAGTLFQSFWKAYLIAALTIYVINYPFDVS